MSISVLVADDQSMVRAGFRLLLSREPDIDVIAEARSGVEAVQQAARFSPTVVLMTASRPRATSWRRTLGPRPDPDDVRPRRVRLRGAPGRRERLRAQG
jgi:DNA-binding NarL/FixJ family response regulator